MIVNYQLEILKITPDVLKEAYCKMKPGKCDVCESFTSGVFLNAPDNLFLHLAEIFKLFLFHGKVSFQILSCAFMPLFKGGLKNTNKSDSYRALAGASQLLKLFEYILLLLWGLLLDTDSMQFSFKTGVSTSQCSWLVLEVKNYFIRRGLAFNS